MEIRLGADWGHAAFSATYPMGREVFYRAHERLRRGFRSYGFSAALVKKLLVEGVLRRLQRDPGQALGINKRICYDVVESQFRSSKSNAFEKGCVRGFSCGATWTKDRAIACGYRPASDLCPPVLRLPIV